MHHPGRSITSLLLLVTLAACSGAPSTAKAEAQLREKVENQSDGRLALASFTKTNAQEGEILGVSVYSLEYEATIEVLETSYWLADYYGARSFRTLAPDEMDVFKEIQGYKLAEKGRKVTYTGTMDFEKTEAGWKGPGGEIY